MNCSVLESSVLVQQRGRQSHREKQTDRQAGRQAVAVRQTYQKKWRKERGLERGKREVQRTAHEKRTGIALTLLLYCRLVTPGMRSSSRIF